MDKLNKRITVLHSDVNFAELLCSLVQASETFSLINRYEKCEDALSFMTRDVPDIIVMGLNFPELTGVEAISKFRKQFSDINVLVVTDSGEEDIVFGALNAGANGCILRDSVMNGFLQHLHELGQGGTPISPCIARTIVESLRNDPLTNREVQVLSLITHGNSYTEIARELKISKETSKTHIRNIYRKLNVSKKSDAVKKAFDDNIVPMTWQIADSLYALLTAREMEVLNLMIHGNSYSQVADILEISNDSAKVHIRSIYYKLNVRKKSDAVKKAFGVEIVTETLNTNDSSQVIPPLPSFTTNEGIMA